MYRKLLQVWIATGQTQHWVFHLSHSTDQIGQPVSVACCRDNATEQLQNLQASQAEKQRMLQILQRLQQQDEADEANLANAASEIADGVDIELSEHMQQKLSMAVRKCMKQVPSQHTFFTTVKLSLADTQATKLDLPSMLTVVSQN